MSTMSRVLNTAIFLARHPARSPGVVFANMMSRRRLREAIYRFVDWHDRRTLKRGGAFQAGVLRVPPASLRYRVHGDLSVQSFLNSGQQCSRDIQRALAKAGQDIRSFHRIFDFGCGCGRTMIWLADVAPNAHFSGSDIDPEAITWCQQNLGFASFAVNEPTPPLNQAADAFDFIYAISVFTHLNEEYQFQWLSELQRVTQPKGYVLLTVHGAYFWGQMPLPQLEEMRQRGFLFTSGPRSMQGIFPEWYQTAFHSREYIYSRYSQYFDVVEHIPAGMDHGQDVVLLQKR